MIDDSGKLVGGIGLARFEFFESCCELQKLYLTDEVKGAGLSYKLIALIEDKAKELGYERIYLETHDNLATALHVYEKCGYKEIKQVKYKTRYETIEDCAIAILENNKKTL